MSELYHKLLESSAFRNSNDQKKYLQPPSGLPNIGNTCHLNTVLQFLYGATKFAKVIERASKHAPKQTSPIKLIHKIFELLDRRNNSSTFLTQVKKYLRQFVYQLEIINLTYKRYQQEDVFEAINNFLNNLQYTEDEQQQIKDLFIVKTKKKCICLGRWINEESMFPLFGSVCQGCRQKFQEQTIKTSKYLILVNPNKIQVKFPINNKHYRFVSAVIYYGTGTSGHYFCIRNQYGKFYRISDNSVSSITEQQLSMYDKIDNSLQIKQKIYMTLYQRWTPEDESMENEIKTARYQMQKKKEEQRKKQGTNFFGNILKFILIILLVYLLRLLVKY